MYSPYFDQEEPQVPVTEMIGDCDVSQPYELDAQAVFKTKYDGMYLVVSVSGCSCWPYIGSTTQKVCNNITDVMKEISYPQLRDGFQNWISNQRVNTPKFKTDDNYRKII